MKKILGSVLAIIVLAGAGLALAAFRGHGDGDPARFERFFTHRLDDMLDDVRATDAQRQKVHALRDRLVADGRALHEGQLEARRDLVAQWKSDAPDQAKVLAIVDARADALKRMADEVAHALLDLHEILTPAQRALITRKLDRHLSE
ncbi:MAG TPA: Spy/CpxP family protein refolding chaperone [Anaeromyxobacteraceae bacterium]|nr:Spy/CpxP family protein refolding chaperone [Anaeromyxobacteraceae bacterium]